MYLECLEAMGSALSVSLKQKLLAHTITMASFIFKGQVLLGMDVGVKQKDQVRHGHETGSDGGVWDLTNYISGDDGIYGFPMK